MRKIKLLKISIFILLTISLCGIVLADNNIVENNITNDIKIDENIISENELNENFIENDEINDNVELYETEINKEDTAYDGVTSYAYEAIEMEFIELIQHLITIKL